MKQRLVFLIILLVIIITQSGCFVFGVKTHLNWKNHPNYKRLYAHYHIKHEQELFLDTSFGIQMRKFYKKNKEQLHDHIQPVQYLLFNKEGRLVSYIINCYIPTNILLIPRWGKGKNFDTFPTKTFVPIDSGFTLADFSKLVKDTSGNNLVIPPPSYDYIELVVFNSALYRVSRSLIKVVKHQDKKGYKVKTFFINSDNSFVFDQSDSTAKRKIRELILSHN